MTDPAADTRARAGSASDRKIPLSLTAAVGGTVGVIVGLSDWLLLECYKSGAFHYVAPSKALVEIAAPVIVLPFAHFASRVLMLIGRKILKALGDNGEDA